jgi:hypothetical protein
MPLALADPGYSIACTERRRAELEGFRSSDGLKRVVFPR